MIRLIFPPSDQRHKQETTVRHSVFKDVKYTDQLIIICKYAVQSMPKQLSATCIKFNKIKYISFPRACRQPDPWDEECLLRNPSCKYRWEKTALVFWKQTQNLRVNSVGMRQVPGHCWCTLERLEVFWKVCPPTSLSYGINSERFGFVTQRFLDLAVTNHTCWLLLTVHLLVWFWMKYKIFMVKLQTSPLQVL